MSRGLSRRCLGCASEVPRRISAYLGVSRRISANLPLLECFYRGVAADVKALCERLVLVSVNLGSSTAWVLSIIEMCQLVRMPRSGTLASGQYFRVFLAAAAHSGASDLQWPHHGA